MGAVFLKEKEMRLAELTGVIVLLLLGVAIFFFSLELPYMAEYGPGPGFLPRWLSLALVGCSVAVLVGLLRKQKKDEPFFKPRTREGVKVLGLIIINFLFLPVLGFSVVLALFTGITMRAMGRHSWVLCGLTALGVAIAIHLIFIQWLTIPLPEGIVGW
jgi:putative tricarboxylic transport membrane protein